MSRWPVHLRTRRSALMAATASDASAQTGEATTGVSPPPTAEPGVSNAQEGNEIQPLAFPDRPGYEYLSRIHSRSYVRCPDWVGPNYSVMRHGYYFYENDEGFGWDKIHGKHNIDIPEGFWQALLVPLGECSFTQDYDRKAVFRGQVEGLDCTDKSAIRCVFDPWEELTVRSVESASTDEEFQTDEKITGTLTMYCEDPDASGNPDPDYEPEVECPNWLSRAVPVTTPSDWLEP